MLYLAKLLEENIAGDAIVHLQFNNEELKVYAEGHQFLFSWKYSEINQSQGFIPPAPASFTHIKKQQYMLLVDDKNLYLKIKKYTQKERSWQDIIKKHAPIYSISLAMILSIAGLYFYGVEAMARFLPWSIQKSMGKKYIQEITAKHPVITDPIVNRLLGKIYNPLIKVAEFNKPITILLIKNPVQNAITLPGGYILLFSGLIEQAKDSEAIAGILAHEIAHVKYQHNIRYMGQALALKFILISTIGYNQIEQGANALIKSKFSRNDEQQADTAAIDYLDQLKVSTLFLAKFLSSISEKDDWLTFSSTHPSTHSRVKTLLEHDNSKNNTYLLTTKEWQLFQKKVKFFLEK